MDGLQGVGFVCGFGFAWLCLSFLFVCACGHLEGERCFLWKEENMYSVPYLYCKMTVQIVDLLT